MSHHAAHDAALVAAAVQAAIRERAPRRTVAAVASAAVGALAFGADRPTPLPKANAVHTRDAQGEDVADGEPALLLASLRAARRAQRLRKKERRRVARQAALPARPVPPPGVNARETQRTVVDPVVVDEVGTATVAATFSEMEVEELVEVPDAAGETLTFSGILSTWVTGFGFCYVTPDDPESLPQYVKDGWAKKIATIDKPCQIFFHKSEVLQQERLKLCEGVAVTFKMYVVQRGEDAFALEVSPASLLTSADADTRSVRARMG